MLFYLLYQKTLWVVTLFFLSRDFDALLLLLESTRAVKTKFNEALFTFIIFIIERTYMQDLIGFLDEVNTWIPYLRLYFTMWDTSWSILPDITYFFFERIYSFI